MTENNTTESICIVTPSFNQRDYLEQTLRSIHEQNYENLEHIVVDPGSDDGSLKLIEKYGNHITKTLIGVDSGQSNALNLGLAESTAEIQGFINSDDLLCKRSLQTVSDAFDSETYWVVGVTESIDTDGYYLGDQIIDEKMLPHWFDEMLEGRTISFPQSSTFWRREIFADIGPFNEESNYIFDHEYFFKVYKKYGKPKIIDQTLAKFRYHDENKTAQNQIRFSQERIDFALTVLDEETRQRDELLACAEQARKRLVLHAAIEKLRAGEKSQAFREAFKAIWHDTNLIYERAFRGLLKESLIGRKNSASKNRTILR